MIKHQKGLTLIELLAVIAIIAILFVLLIPQINSAINKARVSGVQTDLRSYYIGVKSYLMEQEEGEYTQEGLNKVLDKALQFDNYESKELNPWGKPYELIIDDKTIKVQTADKEKTPNVYELQVGYDENGNPFEKFVGLNEENKSNELINWSTINSKAIDPITGLPEGLQANVNENDFVISDNADGTVTIEAYKGNKDVVIVPNTLNGKQIKAVALYAFYPKAVNDAGKSTGKKVKEIVLPEGLQEIGAASLAFNDLEKIYIPSTVQTLGRVIVAYNSPNLKIYVNPNSSHYKNDETNSGMYTKDGKTLYFGTQGTFTTEAYRNIETYAEGAFEGAGVTMVTMPNDTITLSSGTFIANKNMKFNIAPTHTLYKNGTDGEGLYSKDGKSLYFGTKNTFEKPEYDNVERIEMHAFYRQDLKEIKIPRELKVMSNYAFAANKIETVALNSKLETLEGGAFESNNIKHVEIPNSTLIVGEYAFARNPLETYKHADTANIFNQAFPIGAARVN